MSEPTVQLDTRHLPEHHDAIAPDCSTIRVLTGTTRGSMAHGTLDSGQVSLACMHPALDEIWYVVEGQARIWRKQGEHEAEEDVRAGTSLTIPAGTHFQFRTVGAQPFRFVMCTMPAWQQGVEGQAVRVPNHWEPTFNTDCQLIEPVRERLT